MNDALALLALPFVASLCLVGIHTYFGIQVLARKVIFVDLALAQVAALGATAAFMLGHAVPSLAAYAYSLAFTLLAALLLSFMRDWARRIPLEALIGVLYVVTAAAAIVLIDRAPQGAEHLKQILTGNVLTIGSTELWTIVPLYVVIAALHWLLRKRIPVWTGGSWSSEFVFYATFGVVVTSSVALAGVLLVFSFLIIPAAIGVLYADTLPRQLAIGWIAGIATSAIGLAISYAADLPTGAAMVCTFGAALALAALLYPFLRGDRSLASRRLGLACRVGLAAVFAASGLALIAAPRADQPLLDTLESITPFVRELYLTPRENAVYRDAEQSSDHYRHETERLNAIEVSTRSGDRTLDDMEVRRISSFLKSYQEMRRGEEFVKREVRSRGRERMRWIVGGLAILVALLLMPGWLGLVRSTTLRQRRWSVALVVSVLTAIGSESGTTFAQTLSVPPSFYTASEAARPARVDRLDVASPARIVTLPAPTLPEREWVKAANTVVPSNDKIATADGVTGKGRPLAIGYGRDVPTGDQVILADSLEWQELADGGRAARIDVESPGAAALRLALALDDANPGVALRFAGSRIGAMVFGPYAATSIATEVEQHGAFWSPVLDGSTGTIEIHLPPGVTPHGMQLALMRVSHLVVAGEDFRNMDPKLVGLAKSGACEIDVACVLPQTAALTQAAKSVAKIIFTQENGGTYQCTATLLNDSVGSLTPYLFSANHCLNSQYAASTLNAYWFFDAVACNSQAAPPYVLQVDGAKMLARSDDWDWSLVQLKAPPPAGATFSAWRADVLSAPQIPMAVAHHPMGDLKKWSQGTTLGFASYSDGSSFVRVQYTQGSTEGGSSGSGLLTLSQSGAYYELRGGLYGGDASCSNMTGTDIYSRLDIALPLVSEYLTPGAANPGSVAPVVEFYNSALNDYLITIDAQEITSLDSGVPAGWERTGLRFLAYKDPTVVPAGARAVCQLYAAVGNTHFYSASGEECAAMLAQPGGYWTSQSAAAFYIQVPDLGGNCPANMLRVVRYLDNSSVPHRRYSTEVTVGYDLPSWTSEGAVMCSPLSAPPVTLMAFSRKTHGAAGAFDLALSQVASVPTTEPRSGAVADQHDVVFRFTKQVTGGTATITEGNAAAGNPTFNGNEMTIPLASATDAQYVTVNASGITFADATSGGTVSVRLALLSGDVNGSRTVTISDLLAVNPVLAQEVTAQNFRQDVNASGTLSIVDLLFVSARLTHTLPAP